jgi:hypothetical protein
MSELLQKKIEEMGLLAAQIKQIAFLGKEGDTWEEKFYEEKKKYNTLKSVSLFLLKLFKMH